MEDTLLCYEWPKNRHGSANVEPKKSRCQAVDHICFVSWDDNNKIYHSGCVAWKAQSECSTAQCISTGPVTSQNIHSCCCHANLCNGNYSQLSTTSTLFLTSTHRPPLSVSTDSLAADDVSPLIFVFSSCVLMTLLCCILWFIARSFYIRYKFGRWQLCVSPHYRSRSIWCHLLCWPRIPAYLHSSVGHRNANNEALDRTAIELMPIASRPGEVGVVGAGFNQLFPGQQNNFQQQVHSPIRLLELKARGRFASVWTGRMEYKPQQKDGCHGDDSGEAGVFSSRTVAVKIFPLQERQSWLREQEIYRLPRMQDHNNILRFIRAEQRSRVIPQAGEAQSRDDAGTCPTASPSSAAAAAESHIDCNELWLVTDYLSAGSLYDCLVSSRVEWPRLVRIAHSMVTGLAFLHEEWRGGSSLTDAKPSIAHRDMKSKNVLLKDPFTACIADFGLAIHFPLSSTHPAAAPQLQTQAALDAGLSSGGGLNNDLHGQVGTRRYMSPEMLSGAINFSRDSYLRIDMYACGLILWELLSRCYHLPDINANRFQLPFQAEIEAATAPKTTPTTQLQSQLSPLHQQKLQQQLQHQQQHPSIDLMYELVAVKQLRPHIRESWLNMATIAANTNGDANSSESSDTYQPNPAAVQELCATAAECWDHDSDARPSAGCIAQRLTRLLEEMMEEEQERHADGERLRIVDDLVTSSQSSPRPPYSLQNQSRQDQVQTEIGPSMSIAQNGGGIEEDEEYRALLDNQIV